MKKWIVRLASGLAFALSASLIWGDCTFSYCQGWHHKISGPHTCCRDNPQTGYCENCTYEQWACTEGGQGTHKINCNAVDDPTMSCTGATCSYGLPR